MKDLTFDQLLHGAEKALSNGAALVAEAGLLLQHKHFARAHALAHLGREELAKVTMLFRPAIQLLVGRPVNWKKLERRFRSHTQKITSDRLWQNSTTPAAFAVGAGLAKTEQDWNKFLRLATSHQAIEFWNRRKNAALYVTWNGEEFRQPSEEFSEQQAFRTVKLAEFTLEDGKHTVASLRQWGTRKKSEVKAFWQKPLQDLEDKGLL